ncbi:hypothetical protein [uncultured Salegentibacter sp.]|uniref:hypothetical protein n=1 Tax=uncultured Salegentibacter sp. TaxID=259320 RepID=UPI0030D8D69D
MASNYSKTERLVAEFLSIFPGLKIFVKRRYQSLNAILYRKSYRFQCNFELHTIPVEGETFYGYYDHSPESEDGRYILFHLVKNQSTKSLPDAEKPIEVAVYDTQNKNLVYQNSTVSFNWQQGSRLQWLDNRSFIYNKFSEKDGYQSVIVDLESGFPIEKIRPLPIYDCYQMKFALTLNFSRLNKFRPDYGYRNLKNSNLPNYQEDGVFYLDLSTGEKKLIIKISSLKELQPNQLMDAADHKVNHIMISPSGGHFIFLHRYLINGRRFDRLILSDIEGNKLKVLADDDMVSHCCWANDNEIIAYLRDFEIGDRYYKVNIHNASKTIVGENIIDMFGDGHPSVHQDHLVFDTYPNKSRMKDLFHFNLNNDNLTKLGEFYEGMEYYGETRCDLHPRLNKSGNKVYFDSVHEGKRSLYWIGIYDK